MKYKACHFRHYLPGKTILPEWEYELAKALWKTILFLPKLMYFHTDLLTLNIYLPYGQAVLRNKSLFSTRDMQKNVYSSFTHNSPKLKTTQMSTKSRMDK